VDQKAGRDDAFAGPGAFRKKRFDLFDGIPDAETESRLVGETDLTAACSEYGLRHPGNSPFFCGVSERRTRIDYDASATEKQERRIVKKV